MIHFLRIFWSYSERLYLPIFHQVSGINYRLFGLPILTFFEPNSIVQMFLMLFFIILKILMFLFILFWPFFNIQSSVF